MRTLGVGRGDRLFVLAGRVPELYVAVLGALKNGTVVCPLFSAFGPEPIRTRLALGDAGADEAIVVASPITERSIRALGDVVAALR